MSYYLEDLREGVSETFSKTVSERDIELFGEVSGDLNPVHFDQAYAEKTVFKGRIAHGILSAGFISTVLGMKLPGPGSIFVSLSVRFKAPVRIGDTVDTVCTVRALQPRRRVLLECVCRVGETIVTEGEAVVLPPLRPKDGA